MYETEMQYWEEKNKLYCVAFSEEHRELIVESMNALVASNISDLRPYEKKEGKTHYDLIGFAWGSKDAEDLARKYLETLVKEYKAITWKKYP